jgi:DNA-binding NtrC family response regulator
MLARDSGKRRMADILVVDDDQSVAQAFDSFLRFEKHGSRLASGVEDALAMIRERKPDLVLMDVRMPGVDGIEGLQRMRREFPDLYVVIMTAYGTSQTSIDAIRSGAFDYITKPPDLDRLREVIDQALAAQRTRDEADTTADPRYTDVSLVGDSPAMQEVYKMIGRLATNDVPALILGERGTGKQLVVSTIHQNSGRRSEPFVSIDAASTPEGQIEKALTSTGGGTLHIAAVEQLTPGLQAKTLSMLRGRGLSQPAAVRIIASTDTDLAQGMQSGAFNRELYELLAVITIHLPPLRDRREDIPLLVKHLIHRLNEELSRTIRGVDEPVARRLAEHSWPGNVGELESVIKRACIVTRSDVITSVDIGDSLTGGRQPGRKELEGTLERTVRLALHDRLVERGPASTDSPFHDIVDLVERSLVEEALQITNGNQVKASELLGVNRATLRKKMPER